MHKNDSNNLEKKMKKLLKQYSKKFRDKAHENVESETDILMDVFSITPEMKRENMQYWGRELGKCWEKLVKTVLSVKCPEYKPALRVGKDELCEFSKEKNFCIYRKNQ